MLNKTYDICLHVGADLWVADFYIEVKKYLEKKGLTVLLFTVVKDVANVWKTKGITDYILLPELPAEVDESFCVQLMEEMKFESINSFYRTEQIFFNLGDDYWRRQACKYIHAIWSLKDGPKAKRYLTYEGDEFDHNAFRLLCRLHGGHMNYFGYSSFALRTHFHKDEKRFKTTPSEPLHPVISKDDRDWILQYVNKYTTSQTRLWGDPKIFDVKFKWNYFSKAVNKIKREIKDTTGDKKHNFRNSLSRYVKRIYRRQMATVYYDGKLDFEKEKYFYFPLHVPNDSQLTQRGLPFVNQAALVETLSSYIPYPYKLIVKEHPYGRGQYKLDQLKRISRLPNVILVPPHMNSHGIIPKVDAIIAINSSVGFEAIMYKKKVVALGRSFYRENGVTIDIHSLYELETLLSKLKSFELTDEKILNFLWRVKESTYDIDLFNFNAENFHEKVAPFSEAIYKEVYETDPNPKLVS
ncbi:capsular polysaccharide export protein, LipB/KpsS family [Chitinophaga dinghuensis]|nr:hypothetical protein [Chitinophaga dinghuensis]